MSISMTGWLVVSLTQPTNHPLPVCELCKESGECNRMNTIKSALPTTMANAEGVAVPLRTSNEPKSGAHQSTTHPPNNSFRSVDFSIDKQIRLSF